MESEEAVFARRIGQTVGGRWKLERLLGIGGMAAVYAASTADGRTAAIKLLHPEMSRRQDVRERFIRESGVANMLGHPGVVQILEHGSTDDDAYLAMELLVGESLGERVKRQGGMPPTELLDFLDQVLDVLIVAHDKGVIHRDLKPENLFVLRDGRLKVLDFGLARLLDDVPGSFKTRTGLALGTLPYMAPEQALGRRADIDGRVDLFALGATAFRILSGRKLHEAPSEAELLVAMATKPAPPLAQIAALPPELCNIVDLALAFDKDARYPSARLMQEDVRAVRRGEAPPYARSRVRAREEATRADRLAPQIALPNTAPGPATAPLAFETMSTAPALPAAPMATTAMAAPPQAPQMAPAAPPPRKRSALWLGLGLCGVLVCAAALAWGVLRRTSADESGSLTAEGHAKGSSQTEPTAPAVASGAVASEPSAPVGTPKAAAPGRPAEPALRAAAPGAAPPAAPEGAAPPAARSAAGPGARTTAAAIPATTAAPAAAPPSTPPASQPATPAAPAPPPPPEATTQPSPDQGPARGKKPRGRDRRGRGDD